MLKKGKYFWGGLFITTLMLNGFNLAWAEPEDMKRR
jgi:hypothetical protein